MDTDTSEEKVNASGMPSVEEKLQKLKGTRNAMCGHVTRKTNQIRSLMVADGNAEQVIEKLQDWDEAYQHFIDSNNACYSALSVEDREADHNLWYQPRDESFHEFRKQVELWLREVFYRRQQSEIGPDDSISQVGSNTSRKSKKSRSVISDKSSLVSSASAARMKEEAKKAELVARAAMLQKKQALEQEEHYLQLRLRQKKEEFDLQTEIAVTDAKTRVYEQFEGAKCAEQTLNPHAEEYTPIQATQNDAQRI